MEGMSKTTPRFACCLPMLLVGAGVCAVVRLLGMSEGPEQVFSLGSAHDEFRLIGLLVSHSTRERVTRVAADDYEEHLVSRRAS